MFAFVLERVFLFVRVVGQTKRPGTHWTGESHSLVLLKLFAQYLGM